VIALEPGERVVWQSSPGLGEPGASPLDLAKGAAIIYLSLAAVWFVVAVVVYGLEQALVGLAALAAVVGLLLGGALGHRLVGPYPLSFLVLGGAGLIGAVGWTVAVSLAGVERALEQFPRLVGPPALLALLALARIAWGVTRRLRVVHVVTDRRVVRLEGGRAAWETREPDAVRGWTQAVGVCTLEVDARDVERVTAALRAARERA
jgi:hypothetical protein